MLLPFPYLTSYHPLTCKDQLIIATALPKITVEFGALTQLPWLANGFFLTLFG